MPSIPTFPGMSLSKLHIRHPNVYQEYIDVDCHDGGDDVAGCRFNSDTSELESAQNGTMFGKPLSDCTAYNLESSKTTGSIFYPIN